MNRAATSSNTLVFREYTMLCPRRSDRIKSAALRTLKWCESEPFVIGNALAISPAASEPCFNSFRILRRFGSARALKTSSVRML